MPKQSKHISDFPHGPSIQHGPNLLGAGRITPERVGRLLLAKIEEADARKDWDESIRLLKILNRVNRIRARRLRRAA